jgi:hypothetical protein
MKNEDIILLEKNTNELINFFQINKSILIPEQNSQDNIIIDSYAKIESDYKEYYSALKNYKEYSEIYDKNKNDLLK